MPDEWMLELHQHHALSIDLRCRHQNGTGPQYQAHTPHVVSSHKSTRDARISPENSTYWLCHISSSATGIPLCYRHHAHTHANNIIKFTHAHTLYFSDAHARSSIERERVHRGSSTRGFRASFESAPHGTSLTWWLHNFDHVHRGRGLRQPLDIKHKTRVQRKDVELKAVYDDDGLRDCLMCIMRCTQCRWKWFWEVLLGTNSWKFDFEKIWAEIILYCSYILAKNSINNHASFLVRFIRVCVIHMC